MRQTRNTIARTTPDRTARVSPSEGTRYPFVSERKRAQRQCGFVFPVCFPTFDNYLAGGKALA